VQNLQAGRAVLDFYGRSDVRLELPEAFALIDGRAFTQTLLMIHPDSVEADERRCNEVLARLAPNAAVIVGTPRPDRLPELQLGERKAYVVPISNRHIPEKWRDYAIAIYN
jgi:hypothetical protein